MGMEMTEEWLRALEALAGLRLSGEERSALGGELRKILDYMRVLDGAGVASEADAVLENVFRADEVEPSTAREALLRCAPETDGETFLVPLGPE